MLLYPHFVLFTVILVWTVIHLLRSLRINHRTETRELRARHYLNFVLFLQTYIKTSSCSSNQLLASRQLGFSPILSFEGLFVSVDLVVTKRVPA